MRLPVWLGLTQNCISQGYITAVAKERKHSIGYLKDDSLAVSLCRLKVAIVFT